MIRSALVIAMVCVASQALAADSLLLIPVDRDRTGFLIGANSGYLGDDMELIGQELADLLTAETFDSWSSSLSRNDGLALGVFHVFQQTPTLGIQLEGQYVRRGGAIDLAHGAETLTSAFRLDYLEIPLLVRFSPAPLADVRAVLLGGASIGLRVSSTLEVSADDQSESDDVSEVFTGTSVGLIAGLGLSFRVDLSTHIVVQARYYHGLTNVLKDTILQSFSRDLTFVVGMAFEVGD
jgi:hypothetical protein